MIHQRERIVRFLDQVPGRTAVQMSRILNRPASVMSSELLILTRQGRLRREKPGRAWQYYVVVKTDGC